jgi:uncharacterized membrane protein YsdA (DUF1294 family)
VVTGYLPAAVQLVFVLALISALFPSADGALTALTASTCIDLLDLQQRGDARSRKRIRRAVHLGFAALFMALVLVLAQKVFTHKRIKIKHKLVLTTQLRHTQLAAQITLTVGV